ncbi:Structural maintenance of chromosomes protein 4, variant 3 [Stylosanthes scabra]|uniref:Structural maintenance of chromosomes protein 4, variant 3 n=1 Tax=Stylosanthes scabra TaxID=79078 RepID=A0ABU6UL50_9FABA|nr:Structural maintenance of chromosomes protein 4, variant 3 [Stylosanthes scabra]
MLFVFGKRAKHMCLNKVSELIHNSTNHQNLDSAGVSVHFQEIVDLHDSRANIQVDCRDRYTDWLLFRALSACEDGTYGVVLGSDFVITKTGPVISLKLPRSLKGKGEVDQISRMKPKAQGPHDEGFLEYLEDIIGTNKYVEKVDESYKQITYIF